MGSMTFLLPSGLGPEQLRELERAAIAGGPDNMPWPGKVQLEPDRLVLRRDVDESGYLLAPWTVDGMGQIVVSSGTLMERAAPYRLALELARGKTNQTRNQLADWRSGGLQPSAELEREIVSSSLAFGRAATCPVPADADKLARESLTTSCRAAEKLVNAYCDQVFSIRHQRQARLDSSLACRLGSRPPPKPHDAALARAFNTVGIPMSWNHVEAEEATFRWDEQDALVAWAESRGLRITAGPLIDFSAAQLPAWLWLWENDLPSMATFMCKFIEAAVRRYRGKIRRWQLTAASNYATVLHLNEDELLGLTYRLAEAARQIDPTIEVVVGVSQPWGEYMGLEDRTHSPFIFADTLIRSGLNLAMLDLELVMGVTGRGSYCRDLLDTSRMLDMYALLGVPLRVTLGYPSAESVDADADPELSVGAGRCRGPYSLDSQAAWVDQFGKLALCKPFVHSVQWVHFSDQEPHQFPHCGLLDANGQPKPALQRWRDLREKHLA